MDQIKFARQCPQCNTTLYYTRKKYVNYLNKIKSICRLCANKNKLERLGHHTKEKFNCCVCNAEFYDWKSQLNNPETPFCSKKCGCKHREKRLIGQRFGRLLVIKRERRDQTTFYKCKCDCGNFSDHTHTNLHEGTLSCGCLVKETRGGERKPLQEVLERAAWNYYKRNAKTRKYEWRLQYDEFIKLINDNCHYCGIEKSTLHTWRYKNETASLPFNGVDRLDNNIGYTPENSVTCCKNCNFAKNEMSLDDFKSWANRLVNHLNKEQ